jgi:tRNA G18 (ribose-2'-O)-methylase SpoU
VLLLGAEGEGLSPKLRKLADHDIVIPGSGSVESLNVACAVTVMLGEWWRVNRR